MSDRIVMKSWRSGLYSRSYILEGGNHGKEVWVVGRDSLERYWEGNTTGYGNYWNYMPVTREGLLPIAKSGMLEKDLYDKIEKVSRPGRCGLYLNILKAK